MKTRTDVEKPTTARERYNFAAIRKDESWHVATNAERVRILAGFKYWAKNIGKVPAKATSLKVDATDPDGPGYRIWFVSTRPRLAAPTPVPAAVASQEDI